MSGAGGDKPTTPARIPGSLAGVDRWVREIDEDTGERTIVVRLIGAIAAV